MKAASGTVFFLVCKRHGVEELFVFGAVVRIMA